MASGPSIIERAYTLAQSGSCADVAELARQLKLERFESVDSHLGAPTLRRTLAAMCKEARAAGAEAPKSVVGG